MAKERELAKAVSLVTAGIASALWQRLLAVVALLATVSLFALAAYEPQALRITAAALFAVIVFLPALWAEARKDS